MHLNRRNFVEMTAGAGLLSILPSCKATIGKPQDSPNTRKVSIEDLEIIYSLRERLFRVDEIARRTGITKNTVTSCIRKRYNDKDPLVIHVKKLHGDGMSLREI